MSEKIKIIRPQEGFQEKFVRTNVDFSVSGGVLNPQPECALVATPNGFVKISSLKSGDIICDTKGGTQKVKYILDKGELPCVEFTLSDNRTVTSALSHNWLVKKHYGNFLEMTAEKIISYIDKEEKKRKGKVNRLRIPLTKPVELLSEEKLPLHPYLVGYLLGDGCVSDKAHCIYISTVDEEVVEHIRDLGYLLTKSYQEDKAAHYEFKGKGFRQLVKDAGIYGMVSSNKRIPNMYMNASVDDRFELLRGLLDSDGCCQNNSKYSAVRFVTTSTKLRDDVISLIHSLGGTANFSTRKSYNGCIKGKVYNCKESYTINCRLWNDKDFFWLERKKDKAKDNRIGRNAVMLGIKSYKYIGNKHCYCINVDDNDHLYLTNNYVITCNCGKTFAAALSVAEPSRDSRFRGLFLRNNLGDAKASGGIIDTFKEIYGDLIETVESGEPRVRFKDSGARIDITHVADQSRDKVLQRFKGRQYDFIYFDEGTGFTWECFTAIYTRNRGTSSWTGKVRMTTNPDKNHWLRKFLNWYIGVDGFIIPEREGVVRYFFMNGERVEDVVWGDTKKEVYQKCKITIDRTLAKINGKTGTATYEDMIKSFTFYLGKMSENKASISNNSGYAGSVAVMGGRNAQQLLEGNWNVSPEEDEDAPITMSMANSVLMNDPQINGDKWVTCDLADTGTDNFLAIAWDGFHIIDILVLGQTTPKMNAERLEIFAASHNISNSHIIYDAIRGTYINDYIPDAQPFVSYRQPMGLYGRMAYNLKTECYMRFVEAVKRGYISIDEKVAKRVYEHQKIKDNILIADEFVEECAVIRFKDMPSGKKQLFSKKEMNQHLGKNRSMDLCDPIAMRFYPCLAFPYGEELEKTAKAFIAEEDNDTYYRRENIYNDNFWA
jgi:hypothetical protein